MKLSYVISLLMGLMVFSPQISSMVYEISEDMPPNMQLQGIASQISNSQQKTVSAQIKQIIINLQNEINKPIDAKKNTLLHIAALHNKEQYVDALLANKFTTDSFNNDGDTAFSIAIQNNYLPIIKGILQSTDYKTNYPDYSLILDKDNNSPLHLAASFVGEQTVTIIKTLLQDQNIKKNINAANAFGKTALDLAIETLELKIIERDTKSYPILATSIHVLVQAGAQFTANLSKTAAQKFLSAMILSKSIIKLPNIINAIIDHVKDLINQNFEAPGGNKTLLQLILWKELETLTDEEKSVYDSAALQLINLPKFDANQSDENGNTALSYAINAARPAIVKALLNKGATTTYITAGGKSAEDLLSERTLTGITSNKEAADLSSIAELISKSQQ